jgi:hypothetical protein
MKKHFGEITIIDAIDDEYEGKIFTHHWVTLNDEVLEFSKGTLNERVFWNDEYSVNDEGVVKYNSFEVN